MMSRKIIFPPSGYDGPSLVSPSPAKRNAALIKQVEAHTGHIFGGGGKGAIFFGSRGKNRTIPVSKFQRQIYHSSDFDSIYANQNICVTRVYPKHVYASENARIRVLQTYASASLVCMS